MSSKPTLLDMPKVVMDQILQHSDYAAFSSLRKTNYDLRKFISETAAKCSIPAVYIKKRQDSVVLKFRAKRGITASWQPFSTRGGQVNLEYFSHPKGCMVVIEKRKNRKTQRLVRGAEYLDVFCGDLKLILDHPEKFVMEEFKIDFDMMVLENLKKGQLQRFEEFMDVLVYFLFFRRGRLRTQKFIMKIKLEEDVKTLLPLLDPAHLKVIKFIPMIPPKPIPGFYTSFLYLCSDFLMNITQWKSAEQMIIEGIHILGSVEGFLHFRKFEYRTSQIEFPNFEMMMENMLMSDDPERHFRVLTDDSHLPMVQQRYGASVDGRYYFRAPQTRLILQVWAAKFSFEMKLISRTAVPKKRTIRDFYS